MASIEDLLRLTIAELRKKLIDLGEPAPAKLIEALEADPRRGARDLADRIRSRKLEDRAETNRLRRMLENEAALWKEGFIHIAGVDEAGVGPMAGPVVAGAVILPRDCRLRGLDDSKLLDEPTRERLAARIKADAVAWAVGISEVEEIDEINIYRAGLLAMRRAVEGLSEAPHFILVDARTIPECAIPQRGIVKGDRKSASIAAASIIAKTTRDAMMAELDLKYPGYGLAEHKGYATPSHFRALRELGPLPIHRRSYRPVREALGLEPVQRGLFADE